MDVLLCADCALHVVALVGIMGEHDYSLGEIHWKHYVEMPPHFTAIKPSFRSTRLIRLIPTFFTSASFKVPASRLSLRQQQ